MSRRLTKKSSKKSEGNRGKDVLRDERSEYEPKANKWEGLNKIELDVNKSNSSFAAPLVSRIVLESHLTRMGRLSIQERRDPKREKQ